MIISRDKEFIRRKDEARQPAREPVKDTLAGKDRSVQDYDLRRARDAPVDSKGRHRQRQPEPEYPSVAVEAASEEQNSYLSDREADISRTGADAVSFYEKTGYEESGQPEYQGEHFSFRQPESSGASGGTGKAGGSEHTKHRSTLHQHGNKYQQRFQEAAKAEEQPEPLPEDAKKTSKLEFTADELPLETADKKLTHARRKAERTEEKLAQAEKRLPSRKKLRMETVSDPDTGKAAKHLKFEKEVKPQHAHVKGPVPIRPVKAGTNAAIGYAHRKIYQAEEENVGIKAAHRTELAGEAGVRTLYHRHKTAPYRRVAKLQKKSVRMQSKAAYQQVLHENPQLKKNVFARMWQKQKIKRQYAKAAREAKKAGTRVKNTVTTTEKVTMGIVHAVKRHPVICGIVILLLLVFFLITSVFSSFSNIASGGFGGIAASTYLAEDQDINQAELTYTEWETDLQMQIDRVESDRPGYDEYRYQIDAIEHDPYILMGYLTSVYQNFSYTEIEGVLRQLFEEQYSLTFTEETETRYRTETQTDPLTGEETEVEVPYEWHILNVKLTAKPMANLIVARMSADQREICEILLQTKGNRQYATTATGYTPSAGKRIIIPVWTSAWPRVRKS